MEIKRLNVDRVSVISSYKICRLVISEFRLKNWAFQITIMVDLDPVQWNAHQHGLPERFDRFSFNFESPL